MGKEKAKEGKMDMQAVMEVYGKLATPGAPHKQLARAAGSLEHPDQGLDGTR
jgi:hypothetical protein